jgi:hypothetical protein
MFKKLLQSLTKSSKPAAPPPVQAPTTSKSGSLLDKVGSAKPAQPEKAVSEKTIAKTTQAKLQTPEEMCGITSKMGKDEIRAQLKLLYRRYNRGASSLNAQHRSEADAMLDAIVAVREKVFGEI